MSQEEKTTEKKPTQKEIAAWKKEHGRVYALTVDGKYKAYIKQPDVTDIKRAMAYETKRPENQLAFSQNIFENCVLHCDVEIKDNGERWLAALGQVGEVVKVADAEIKEV